jgi:arylsulfatase A-like enzyme/Tfp pilus assembly protein PilF
MPQILVRLLACSVLISAIEGSLGLYAQTRQPPIILVSVDTLRADHLSCYGYRALRTPNIDRLTSGGTLFGQVDAQAPLTLPSHASLFTSKYPFATQVKDNGEQLAPGAVTLASQLKALGYRTAAFVGGFALDRRFGLAQGFDHYHSPFDLRKRSGPDTGDIKRPAGEVLRDATRWIAENSAAPFFVFLHLYDLHTPYDLPRHLQLRFYGNSYDSELAYVDETLGNFWKFLSDRKLFDRSLVAFTSDHGEGLGNHGESTHGYFIYQSTLHVPLIIRWPAGSGEYKQRVDQPAELIQLAPTLLEFLSASVPVEMQGKSLLAAAKGQPLPSDRPVYSESHYAAQHFGCAVLRSIRIGRHKYIEAPKPELYDLAVDTNEQHNLYTPGNPVAASLREKLQGLINRAKTARAPRSSTPSAQAIDALRSLGYIAGSSSESMRVSGIDPKDRLPDFEAHNRAIVLASSGRLQQSNAVLERLIRKLPDVTELRTSLGLNLQRMGLHAEASHEFKEVIQASPRSVIAHFNLALSLYQMRQFEPSLQHLQRALELDPKYIRAEELLGTIRFQNKDYTRARTSFQRLLEMEPDNYAAHFNLGVLATLEGKWDEGETHLRRVLQIDSNSAEAYNALGSLYMRRGVLPLARAAFSTAIRLQPRFAWAHYNLGLVLQRENKRDDAAREFRAALDADPRFTAAQTALERLEKPAK